MLLDIDFHNLSVVPQQESRNKGNPPRSPYETHFTDVETLEEVCKMLATIDLTNGETALYELCRNYPEAAGDCEGRAARDEYRSSGCAYGGPSYTTRDTADSEMFQTF